MNSFFVGIGSPKSGTTTISKILNCHPNVNIPKRKELYFFNNEKEFAKGKEYYLSLLGAEKKQYSCLGEFSPGYLANSEVPHKIFDFFNSDIKFILCLRDPFERAYSHFLFNKVRGYESRNFITALNDEKNYIAQNRGSDNFKNYLYPGFYYKHIKNYLNFFSLDNFHIIFFEDIKEDIDSVSKSLFDFLELKQIQVKPFHSNKHSRGGFSFIRDLIHKDHPLKKCFHPLVKDKNLRKTIMYHLDLINRSIGPKLKKPELPIDLHEKTINQVFLNDIKKLEVLLNKDLSHWYSK